MGVIALGMAAAPGETRAAGCAHPGLRISGATAHFDELIKVGAIRVGEAERPEVPAKPCTGLFCTGHEGVPTAPVVALEWSTSLWAVLSWSAGDVDWNGVMFVVGREPATSVIEEGGVFHPPRV
jgi:hypothetical protein